MSFHNRYHFDKAAKTDGTWVDLEDGLAIKVRSFDSPASREARRLLEDEYRPAAQANGGKLPAAQSEELMLRQIADAILLDWRGVTEENGDAIPYSPDNGLRILKKYPDFQADVVALVMNRATFRKQLTEADLGN